jgi:hypothetical protein
MANPPVCLTKAWRMQQRLSPTTAVIKAYYILYENK